ncbi:MAG: hypothetical protein IJF18_04275 [Oscillospiraceae bacterium]|nr:hypothetical protein [Oscillospiraceae bacterium]
MEILSKKRTLIRFIAIAAVSVYMLILNFRCGYLSDDYHFKFVWRDFNAYGTENRIDSLGEILLSMKNYYMMSGGRVLCHFIAYVLLVPEKWLFNILNTAVFVMMGLVIEGIAKLKTHKQHNWLLPMIYISMLLFLPCFGDNVLWLSGAVNYLWPTVLMLCTILMTEKYSKASSRLKIAEISLLVLFSAMTNEISGGMLIIFILLKMISDKGCIKNLAVPLLCTLPGMAVVLLAPGNANRRIVIERKAELGLGGRIINVFNFADKLMDSYGILIFAAVLFILYTIYTNKSKLTEICGEYAWLVTAAAGYCAIGLSGVGLLRPTFMPIGVLFAGIFGCAAEFTEKATPESVRGFFEKMSGLIIAASLLYMFYVIIHELLLEKEADAFKIMCISVISLMFLLTAYIKGKFITQKYSELSGILKKTPIIVLMISLGFILLKTNNAMYNYREYDIWLDESVKNLKAGREIVEYVPMNHDISFFPKESSSVPNEYIKSWLYQYYIL